MRMDNKTVLFFLFIMQLTMLHSQNNAAIDGENSLYMLPDNMPLQTKLLWSQNGLLRKTKLFNVDRPRELILRKKMFPDINSFSDHISVHQTSLNIFVTAPIINQGY